MKQLYAGLLGAVVALSTTVTSVASANTNETSVNHGVCDAVKDATPGLFGLCVAYCEAQMGPELVDPENLSALKPSHRNILRNYERRMKQGDPQMPCVNYTSACPVFSADELAKINVVAGDFYEDDFEYASANADAQVLRESVRTVSYYQMLPYWRDGRTSPLVSALISARNDNGKTVYGGQYYDKTGETVINRYQELTEEEYNSCKSAILNNVLDTDSGGFCGDGLQTSGPEQCDDGNNIDGDGCSAICTYE